MCVIDRVAMTQGGGAWDQPQKQSTCVMASIVTIVNAEQDSTTTKKTGPYLCTGYDVYVTREPCVMCAMALVHSRVRRVFYGCHKTDGEPGGLGSFVSVHLLKGINHHYEVFAGVLEEDCRTASLLQPVYNVSIID